MWSWGGVHSSRASSRVGDIYRIGDIKVIAAPAYCIDKYEVTNEQYKNFVDAGGYRNQEYWQHKFIRNNRTLSWEQAMSQFHDKTGQPGPSTWGNGTYLEGQGKYPVSGVSWYEAAAYDRTVDTHVYRLRQKLGAEGEIAQRIVAVRGIGYKFERG